VALQIYKKEQGKYVRVSTAVGAAVVLLVVCYYAWLLLERHLPGGATTPGADAEAGVPYKVYLEYAIPAVMFAALAVVGLFYMNKPVVVDFLIATESEMKKVSWSSRAELVGSTAVVLVTVFLLALFIWLADFGIIFGLSRGLGLW
jgi:preprotein translocase subunit SecE